MRVLNIMMGKKRGGLENAALDAYEALTLAGCEVTTLLHSSAEMREKFPASADVMTFSTPGLWDPTADFRLKRILDGTRFDVILAHGNRAAKLAITLRKKAPLVLVCHTTNYSSTEMIEQIDGAIVLTNHYRDVMLKAGCPPAKLRLVPNAVRLGPEPGDPPQRKIPLIGGLGRLVPNKGFDILLEALAILKRRGTAFSCIIHGVDDNGRTESFEAMRDRLGLDANEVAFPGWTKTPHDFLRSLDIFAMPSRREVLSIALLEALAAGRPIVCAQVPGLEDVFSEGNEGFFVDIGDVEGLATALESLLNNAKLRGQMGHAARERARRFDIATIGLEMRNALESLMAQPKRP